MLQSGDDEFVVCDKDIASFKREHGGRFARQRPENDLTEPNHSFEESAALEHSAQPSASDRISLLPSVPARTVGPADNHSNPYLRASKKTQREKDVRGGFARDQKARATRVDPLFEACRLVAERLGVTLQQPPDSPQPTTVLQCLEKLCDSSKLHSRKVLLRGDWWRHDHGPLLGFMVTDSPDSDADGLEDRRRPVAIIPSSETSYRLIDPQAGTTMDIDAQVARSLDQRAFMLYPAPIKILLSWGDFLRPAIHRHWRDLGGILLIALGGGLLNMLVPIMTEIIYGRIIPGGNPSEVPQAALVLVAAALGAGGFQITRALSVLRLTAKLDLDLQPIVWGRLLALPVSFLRRFTVGDLADRVRGVGLIRQFLLADVSSTALALAASIPSFGLLFYFSWPLALLASGLVGCLITATLILSILQLGYRQRYLDAQGKISSLVFALVQGISKLRSSGAESRSHGVWAGEFAKQTCHMLRAQRIATFQASLNAFYFVTSELALFALMGFGLHARLSLSGFLAFSAAFGQIQAALLIFISLIPELIAIFPIYKRLQPIFDEPPEANESKMAIELSGDIEVHNVSFRYHEDAPLVLDCVSFKVCAGEFIAIVGPSGSGKSTLIRLLLGFDRPNSGFIRYDNRDLASLDMRSVRRQIGTVLQNSMPLTGDIVTNIIGATSSDFAAAWEAVRIAGIEEEIRAMPMGMHTIIGEGATTFSGGERQRLMIARAVVNRPRIILLDEATSALDNPTQDKVQRCLEGLNATRIVVAHRVSTIRNADRIYVLDSGRIVEEGKYKDLRMRGGYFAEIVRRQIY